MGMKLHASYIVMFSGFYAIPHKSGIRRHLYGLLHTRAIIVVESSDVLSTRDIVRQWSDMKSKHVYMEHNVLYSLIGDRVAAVLKNPRPRCTPTSTGDPVTIVS